MGNSYEIKNLEELLQQYIGSHTKIIDVSIKPLTAAGDNYGSQMLAAEIKLQDKETLNVVAKMCPPNEFLKKVFDSALTFKKEIAVYRTIFPALRDFQKERGVTSIIEFFPACYGTRLSLNPASGTVDDDAVLLLENLKILDYRVVDRMVGFDLESTELLLKDLAVFHAVPIALKLLKPDLFRTKVLTHLKRTPVFDNLSEGGLNAIIDFAVNTAKLNPDSAPLAPRIEQAMRLGFRNMTNPPPVREPFATMNHNDYWVNNTMIKFENNNPVSNKMVDFQLVDYGSPAHDIVFFLFSSVQTQVLKSHYDRLIKLYYDTFIAALKELKCDTTSFTRDLLEEEITICAKSTQFFHATVMLRHIFAVKGKVKELSEITEDDLTSHTDISEACQQKLIDIVLYFSKQGWI